MVTPSNQGDPFGLYFLSRFGTGGGDPGKGLGGNFTGEPVRSRQVRSWWSNG